MGSAGHTRAVAGTDGDIEARKGHGLGPSSVTSYFFISNLIFLRIDSLRRGLTM